MAPELDLVDSLAQTSFLVHDVLRRVGQRHYLSLTQLRLLGILRDREPGILELAGHLELDKSSVTGLVDRAAARGLVERTTRPEDRRAVAVKLTAAGRRLATRGAAEVREELLAATANLTDTQRQQLSSLLSRVVPAPEL